MSVEAVAWVLNDAPVNDPIKALILVAMAETANADGTEARAAQATYAARARCSDRTYRRHLRELEDAGLIRRGDQSLVAHLRPDRRPVVWDLVMTAGHVRPVVDDRPDSNDRSPETARGERPDTGDRSMGERPDTGDQNGRTLLSDKPSLEPPLTEEPPRKNVVVQPEIIDAEIIEPGPAVPADAVRQDVESACQLLADLMVENGCRRPTITKAWRDAARLMIDKDERPYESVIGAIRWSQQHDFWKSNILSMPKLREKYDTMRLQAERNNQPREATTDRKVREGMELAQRLRAQGR